MWPLIVFSGHFPRVCLNTLVSYVWPPLCKPWDQLLTPNYIEPSQMNLVTDTSTAIVLVPKLITRATYWISRICFLEKLVSIYANMYLDLDQTVRLIVHLDYCSRYVTCTFCFMLFTTCLDGRYTIESCSLKHDQVSIKSQKSWWILSLKLSSMMHCLFNSALKN